MGLAEISCAIHCGDLIIYILFCGKGKGSIFLIGYNHLFGLVIFWNCCYCYTRRFIRSLDSNGGILCGDVTQYWSDGIQIIGDLFGRLLTCCIFCRDGIGIFAFHTGLEAVGTICILSQWNTWCYCDRLYCDIVCCLKEYLCRFLLPAILFYRSCQNLNNWCGSIRLRWCGHVKRRFCMVAGFIGNNDSISAICRSIKGIGAIAVARCIVDIAAVFHLYRSNAGQIIRYLESEGTVSIVDLRNNRESLVNTYGIDAGCTAVSAASTCEEVVILLPLFTDSQCSVAQLSAIGPLRRGSACRTFIGICGAVCTVTGQGKYNVLIGPAAVWIAAAVLVIHIDRRC